MGYSAHLFVLYEQVSLSQCAPAGARVTRSVFFGNREQCDERDGENREGEGPRRVLLAPPSLHSVKDGVVVHYRNIFMHARSCAVTTTETANAPALVSVE
jgi:hypothetical protein